jgi:hypothetical protein
VLDAASATVPEKDREGHACPPPEGRSPLGALDGNVVPLEKPIVIDHNGNRADCT